MTEPPEEEINLELSCEIKRSIEFMLHCAAHDNQLAKLRVAIFHGRVCEALDALAGETSQVRRIVLTHQLRKEQEWMGSDER